MLVGCGLADLASVAEAVSQTRKTRQMLVPITTETSISIFHECKLYSSFQYHRGHDNHAANSTSSKFLRINFVAASKPSLTTSV